MSPPSGTSTSTSKKVVAPQAGKDSLCCSPGRIQYTLVRSALCYNDVLRALLLRICRHWHCDRPEPRTLYPKRIQFLPQPPWAIVGPLLLTTVPSTTALLHYRTSAAGTVSSTSAPGRPPEACDGCDDAVARPYASLAASLKGLSWPKVAVTRQRPASPTAKKVSMLPHHLPVGVPPSLRHCTVI